MNVVFLEVMVQLALLGHQEQKDQLAIKESLAQLVIMVVPALQDYKV